MPEPQEEMKIKALDNSTEEEEEDRSCDLTGNSCDTNCCQDKDCSWWEKESFDCEVMEQDEHADECVEEPFLCLHHSNSPYLGKFYPEPEESFIERSGLSGFPPPAYQAQKPVLRIPYSILGKGGLCLLRPLRPASSVSHCLYSLTPDSCRTNPLFNKSYFISSQKIFKDMENVTLTPETICLNNGSAYVTLSRNVFQGSVIPRENEEVECRESYFTKFNEEREMCENVVVGVTYILNKSVSGFLGGRMKVLTADVPVTIESLASSFEQNYELSINPYLYLSLTVRVHFSVTIPEKAKEGYTIGEKLRSVI